MEDLIELAVSSACFIFLILLGLFAGGAAERNHLKSLAQRESQLAGMLVTQIRSFPGIVPSTSPPTMVAAEVVIASDYLKVFLGGLKKFFGGEIKSFQTMLDRARREATLRIMEEAHRQGYNAICNLRLDTVQVDNTKQSKSVMATILASGTAYHAARP